MARDRRKPGPKIGPPRPSRRLSELLEAKFRGLLEAAPAAMVIMNQAGRLVLINAQPQRLFGYSHDELLGAPVEILIPSQFRKGHPAFRKVYFEDPKPPPKGPGLGLFGRRKDGRESPAEISLCGSSELRCSLHSHPVNIDGCEDP